ncbi:MAG: PAC2 family protein [Dehalococcoidia bacterium]
MHESLQLTGELSGLRDPLVVGAFFGWSDGSGSALAAIRYMRSEWRATEVANVDPDRFYDLTVARPRVRLRNGERSIRWPGTRFHAGTPTGSSRDVVLISGREPALAWKEYAALVADFMQTVGARHFISLGSRPAMVPHTRPAPVLLGDADAALEALMGRPSEASQYQGPTGIQTVLMVHLRSLGYSTGRLTALVPGYINTGPNPRAMVALVQHLDKALGSHTPIEPLLGEIASFDQQTTTALGQVADPDQLRDQIRQMEETYDASEPDSMLSEPAPPAAELPTSDEILEGIESFLRQQRDETDEPRR